MRRMAAGVVITLVLLVGAGASVYAASLPASTPTDQPVLSGSCISAISVFEAEQAAWTWGIGSSSPVGVWVEQPDGSYIWAPWSNGTTAPQDYAATTNCAPDGSFSVDPGIATTTTVAPSTTTTVSPAPSTTTTTVVPSTTTTTKVIPPHRCIKVHKHWVCVLR